MAANETSFSKGRSGNPNGRPPKNRTLTNILARAGGKKVLRDGRQTAARQVAADLIWEAITTGAVKFSPEQPPQPVPPKDWVGLVRFLYSQIDGPPPAAVDVTSNGETVQGAITIMEVHHQDEQDE